MAPAIFLICAGVMEAVHDENLLEFAFPDEVQQFLPAKFSLQSFADCAKILNAARRGLEALDTGREKQKIDLTVKGTNVKSQEIMELKSVRERLEAFEQESRSRENGRQKELANYKDQVTVAKRHVSRLEGKKEDLESQKQKLAALTQDLDDVDSLLSAIRDCSQEVSSLNKNIKELTEAIQKTEALL